MRLGLVEVAALELAALELATEEERAGEDATLTGAFEEEVALTWLLVGDALWVDVDGAAWEEDEAAWEDEAPTPLPQKVMRRPALSVWQATWTVVSSGWKNAVEQSAVAHEAPVPSHPSK